MKSIDDVDLARLFYVWQDGRDVAGPFSMDQVGTMYRSGSIYATAQICEVGSEKWSPVTRLRSEFPAAFAAGVQQRVDVSRPVEVPAYNVGIYRVLGLFFGCIGVHNFYAGEVGAAAFKLIAVGFSIGLMFFGDFGVILSTLIWIFLIIVSLIEIFRGHG